MSIASPTVPPSDAVRPITRWWLGVASVGSFVIAPVLAWSGGLTAATLAAFAVGVGVLTAGAYQQERWSRARIALPGVTALTLLALEGTLLPTPGAWGDGDANLGPTLFAAGMAAATAWQAAALAAQFGREPRPSLLARPVLGLERVLTALLFAASVPGALVLALTQPPAAPLWPWEMPFAAARIVGACLAMVAVSLLQVLQGRSLRQHQIFYPALAVMGALQLATLARYAGEVDGSRPVAWVYVGLWVGAIVLGWRLYKLSRAVPQGQK